MLDLLSHNANSNSFKLFQLYIKLYYYLKYFYNILNNVNINMVVF